MAKNQSIEHDEQRHLQHENHHQQIPAKAMEDLCKLQPMRIPRPKCQGMQFVQTSGRQGFYLSLRRKERSSSYTPLSSITFTPPGLENCTNDKAYDKLNTEAALLSLRNQHHQQKEQMDQKHSSTKNFMTATKMSA